MKYVCAVCGKEFESDFKSKIPKYCSRYCHDHKYLRKNEKCLVCGKPLPKGREKYCSNECRNQVANSNFYSERGYTPHGEIKKICAECGKEFTTYRSSKQTCSENCRKRFRNRLKDRRFCENNIIDADITLKKLFKRDGGICYICGKECSFDNKKDGHVFGSYPSVEHIVPLSKGGKHSWDNVKLACISCNCKKGTKFQ